MRRVFITIALIGLDWSGSAQASRCSKPTAPTAYRQASAVLVGTVTGLREVGQFDRAYSVTVEKSWKRRLGNKVTVGSVRSSSLAEFSPGQRYLIYVVMDSSGVMRTTNCQGNALAADADAALAWLRNRS